MQNDDFLLYKYTISNTQHNVYVLQTSSKSLRCKYGFSDSKPWNVGKSWIILGLKLNRDAFRGDTIHDDASVLVGFI